MDFQAQETAIFPRVDTGIKDQLRGDPQRSGGQIQLFQLQIQMRTMALELRRLQSDMAALKQSLIEIESRDDQSL